MNAATFMAAVDLLEKIVKVSANVGRARELARELMDFVREHREIEGITAEQRARAYNVLALDPGDVRL